MDFESHLTKTLNITLTFSSFKSSSSSRSSPQSLQRKGFTSSPPVSPATVVDRDTIDDPIITPENALNKTQRQQAHLCKPDRIPTSNSLNCQGVTVVDSDVSNTVNALIETRWLEEPLSELDSIPTSNNLNREGSITTDVSNTDTRTEPLPSTVTRSISFHFPSQSISVQATDELDIFVKRPK